MHAWVRACVCVHLGGCTLERARVCMCSQCNPERVKQYCSNFLCVKYSQTAKKKKKKKKKKKI